MADSLGLSINERGEMVDEAEIAEPVSQTVEERAAQRARDRARNARWDLNIAIFLFAVLIIVIILLFQGVPIEIVAPVAVFGLAMVWLCGWRQGQQLYRRFYSEELARLKQDLKKKAKQLEKTIEETVEEKVQRALRERWK